MTDPHQSHTEFRLVEYVAATWPEGPGGPAVVSYWHRNPLRRVLWRLRRLVRQ